MFFSYPVLVHVGFRCMQLVLRVPVPGAGALPSKMWAWLSIEYVPDIHGSTGDLSTLRKKVPC